MIVKSHDVRDGRESCEKQPRNKDLAFPPLSVAIAYFLLCPHASQPPFAIAAWQGVLGLELVSLRRERVSYHIS